MRQEEQAKLDTLTAQLHGALTQHQLKQLGLQYGFNCGSRIHVFVYGEHRLIFDENADRRYVFRKQYEAVK